MTVIIHKGRRIEIEKCSHRKDPVDSHIESAFYTDTGENLNDEELDNLQTERSDICYDDWFEHQLDRADFARKAERENG